jgi:ubiquitin-protein ligase
MDARRRKAQLRLQRDLMELAERSWELPTVSALPLEDNILEWHCNIVGSGENEGVVLHLKLLFPETYPHQPPEVVLMSKVCHPHVFDDHVCLDMLEEGQWSDAEERAAEFTGWSTCYSVFSILMQLQAFLFDLGNNAKRTRAAAAACECFCGHGVHRVYPPLPEPMDPPARPAVLKDPFQEDSASSTRASDDNEDEVSGVVTRVEPYGVFIRVSDGRVGLLRRSDTPRGRFLEDGDRVTCRTKSLVPKLALTMLRSEEQLQALAAAAVRIPASVVSVKPYGAFVDVGGHSALLHRSEMGLLEGSRIPWVAGDVLSVRLLGNPGPKLAVSGQALYLLPSRARPLMDGDVDLGRLRCFHSKAGFSEAVLGVGVSLQPEESGNGQMRYHLTSIYDTLACESFRDGVRKGVWKQKFSEFLPLALDGEHFRRSQKSLEDTLARLSSGKIAEMTRSHGKSREDREAEYRARITLDEYRALGKDAVMKTAPASLTRPTGSSFTPEMILEVIPKLMNSQVVLLSNGQLWRCEKALEGYFAYHHLLLHCMAAYPALRDRVEAALSAFKEDPEARVKARVANMGEFLCLVSVSDKHGWEDLGVAILEEIFDRNVLWILKQSPHLGNLTDNGVSMARLRHSFNANRVSLRLLMFQVAFLQLVKPVHIHETGSPQCCAASSALERKDRCKGLPGPGEAEWLFQRCLSILAVDDFEDFLDHVGAAAISDEEMCRWLRHSVIRSIGKGYHNPRVFQSLAEKASRPKTVDCNADPDDFGMDTRPKESKAQKRARRHAVQTSLAVQSQQKAEFERALNWARFYSPHGYLPRQTCIFVSEKGDLSNLEGVLGSGEVLQQRYQGALPGYRLLDGMTLAKVKAFPARLWFGLGCTDCSRFVRCEISGRCMSCCRYVATAPVAPKPIKGLVGENAPVARFSAFQAAAVMPVQWEMHLEVAFDGLVADLAPLRAALAGDLAVTQQIQGGMVFSRVERAGRKLWEKSPEQVIFPGSKLIAGWMGVTDAVFQTTIRGRNFVLLSDTMHELNTLEDIERLKMARTYCKDHILRDEKTKEIIWDRPCKNCRGVLRLQFSAPKRYAQRRAQLESLGNQQLVQRAQLCGLIAEVTDVERRKDAMNHIIKSEGIIR